MHVNTYLTFNGNCEAAFKYYAKALGGKIDAMVPHEGTPAGAHVPAEWSKKILHAMMTVGGTVLMGSDAPEIATKSRKAFLYRCRRKRRRKRSVRFWLFQQAVAYECRYRRPSSRDGSACWWISSGFRG
jgi:predicted 3-demethylubiquinone-9 3-methyltransferase (glyoxalase superfamily)